MGLDNVDLILSVEKHFNIIFLDEDVMKTKTIGELSNLVCKYIYVDNSSKNEFETIYSELKNTWKKEVKLVDSLSLFLPLNERESFQKQLKYAIPKHSSEKLNYFKKWLNYYLIDWEDLTVEQFINTLLIYNRDSFFKDEIPTTNYGVYIVTARIIYDCIGCPFYDLQPTSHIINDLRID